MYLEEYAQSFHVNNFNELAKKCPDVDIRQNKIFVDGEYICSNKISMEEFREIIKNNLTRDLIEITDKEMNGNYINNPIYSRAKQYFDNVDLIVDYMLLRATFDFSPVNNFIDKFFE
jgi:hypothetical protein